MVGESNQNVFLIQIDASSFAKFEISKFELSRVDCIFMNFRCTTRLTSPSTGIKYFNNQVFKFMSSNDQEVHVHVYLYEATCTAPTQTLNNSCGCELYKSEREMIPQRQTSQNKNHVKNADSVLSCLLKRTYEICNSMHDP